jgi:drug/metabolite transporter (DMT)-like permease
MERQSQLSEASVVKTDSGLWLRLMLVAFFANGLGPFGLKVLTERNLTPQFQSQYLFYWYVGGLLFALVALGSAWRNLNRREILLGAAMGASSLGGQAFTGLALSSQVPGHIVFPITTGGSLFVVATVGILVFGEKVGGYGLAGILLGITSLVLLSIP